MSIKQWEIDNEILRMKVEREEFGRFLLVGTGESEQFWRSERGKEIESRLGIRTLSVWERVKFWFSRFLKGLEE